MESLLDEEQSDDNGKAEDQAHFTDFTKLRREIAPHSAPGRQTYNELDRHDASEFQALYAGDSLPETRFSEPDRWQAYRKNPRRELASILFRREVICNDGAHD